MIKTSKTVKKSACPAKRKRATSRAFPYEQVAKMWAQEQTIPQIAKAIGRVIDSACCRLPCTIIRV